MRLLLIRHGQTPSNVAGELDTAVPGAGLTALGQAQAAALPAALADQHVVGIHVSDLVRTHETAAPLAAALGLEPTVHPGLREISAGDLEMRSGATDRTAYAECVAAWMTGDPSRTMPGGHDGHEFTERYDAAMAEVAAAHGDGDTVVVISHGAAIRAYTALRAPGVSAAEAVRLGIANTGAATLQGHPATGWELVAWSDHPLGGEHLLQESALDVTGESVEDERQHEADRL